MGGGNKVMKEHDLWNNKLRVSIDRLIGTTLPLLLQLPFQQPEQRSTRYSKFNVLSGREINYRLYIQILVTANINEKASPDFI